MSNKRNSFMGVLVYLLCGLCRRPPKYGKTYSHEELLIQIRKGEKI